MVSTSPDSALMVIDNLNVFRISSCPAKAYPELVIDPDRMLAVAITFELFQTVAGRASQIVESNRRIQHDQFPPRQANEISRKAFPRSLAIENRLGMQVIKARDHQGSPLSLILVSIDDTKGKNK